MTWHMVLGSRGRFKLGLMRVIVGKGCHAMHRVFRFTRLDPIWFELPQLP